MKLIVTAILMCLTLSAFARPESYRSETITEARAVRTAQEWRPHIGLLYGVIIPEGSYNTTDSLGVDIGFQPYIPFGLGLEFVTTNLKRADDSHFNRNDLLAKASYHFGGDNVVLKNSYLGFGAGVAMTSGDAEMVVAPLMGFDVPLSHRRGECYFSLGANAKYSFYTADQPDALTANAVLKFWF